MPLSDATYARLLTLRSGLRHFERWSANQARAAGLTPAHHQLLLAIRGHAGPAGPTIGEVADYLLLRHHSAVGLVDRAESAGLVGRTRSEDDHRVVRLHVTEEGAARLEALSALHLEELDRLALDVTEIWAGLDPVQRTHGFPGKPGGGVDGDGNVGVDGGAGVDGDGGSDGARGEALVRVEIAHIDDELDPGIPHVLVDRVWPRGVPKHDPRFDIWAKDLAPSAALRSWYGQTPRRYEEFARRYRKELGRSPANVELGALRAEIGKKGAVLVTSAKDLGRSGASVLRDVLLGR